MITGWPPGLMQDDCKKLSQWLSTRVDARHVHRINVGKQMNLYLLTGTESGYNTYDSCVVAAPSEEVARTIHPNGTNNKYAWTTSDWASSHESVTAKLIGTALEGAVQGAICASFHRGPFNLMPIKSLMNQGNK